MYAQNLIVLKELLIKVQGDKQIKSLLLFGGDKNRPSSDDLIVVMKENTKPLLGGFFPEIIADGLRKEEGFVLIPVFEELTVVKFDNNVKEDCFGNSIAECLSGVSGKFESVFCFFNALWENKKSFMHHLYDELGPFVNYLGGGAGSLSFQSFPCVFANQEIVEHGAVLGAMKKAISIGVAHGWHPISDLIKVTETRNNTILSLNWKPAFDVYKENILNHSGLVIDQNNFFDIAKSYPLGLVKLDDEMIIRDPFATEKGFLHIVDEVPEGEYIRIMHGDLGSLLDGTKSAVENSNKLGYSTFTQICIDCISRVLFMQEDYKNELTLMNKNQAANGVLSIGEIANPGNSALELYNKTVVIAQWKKEV
jgi:hypothetical protein